MTTFAVVGNGKSAVGLGKEIEAQDMVVRCGQWANVFKKREAGKRMDIWAWPGYAKMNKYQPPMRHYTMWITCPVKWHKGGPRGRNVRALCHRVQAKAVWMPLPEYMRVRRACMKISHKDLPPSTGMLAIACAMMAKPTGMFIAGFDAGIVGHYHYADGRPASNTLHPYAAEAELIRQLTEGFWLGEEIHIPVEWRKP